MTRVMMSRNLAIWTVLLGILCLAQPAIAAVTQPYNHKAVFRYRSYTGSNPSWVSSLTSSGGITHSTSGDVVSTNRGDGFSSFLATDFNGSNEFVQGASSIDVTDSNGYGSFAIEAWFKADSVTGWRTLFSNTENYRGFSLKIHDGRLRGLVRFDDNGSSHSEELYMDTSEPDLETGRWYYAVFYVKENTSQDRFDLKMYLDGKKVGENLTSQRWDGVYQSSEKPMVGAEPSGGGGGGNYFDGQIYAVTVSNWAIYLNNYVKTQVARDGSRYFGTGSYHDYLDTTAGMAYRMHQTVNDFSSSIANQVVERFQVPFMNDKYVPQGVAYDSTNDRVYVSMYWKDSSGTTGTYPSIIAEVTGSGDFRRVIQLRKSDGSDMTGHVGGLAFNDDMLYVTYGSGIYRYDLADLPNPNYVFDPDDFSNPRGDQNPVNRSATYPGLDLEGNTSNSALDIAQDSDGDTLLWTAQYVTGSYAKLLGFEIDGNGDIASTAKYVLTLPVTEVQGIACFNATSSHLYFYISSTNGPGGDLYQADYLKSTSTVQTLSKVFEGPRGIEDIAMQGTDVWTVSESGAQYFQKKSSSPWETLFPFIYRIDP